MYILLFQGFVSWRGVVYILEQVFVLPKGHISSIHTLTQKFQLPISKSPTITLNPPQNPKITSTHTSIKSHKSNRNHISQQPKFSPINHLNHLKTTINPTKYRLHSKSSYIIRRNRPKQPVTPHTQTKPKQFKSNSKSFKSKPFQH